MVVQKVEKFLEKRFHGVRFHSLLNRLKRKVLPEVIVWILPKLQKKMHQDCAYTLLWSLPDNTVRDCYRDCTKCLLI